MKAVGKLLSRLLTRPHDVFEANELSLLFKDDAFIKNIGEPCRTLLTVCLKYRHPHQNH